MSQDKPRIYPILPTSNTSRSSRRAMSGADIAGIMSYTHDDIVFVDQWTENLLKDGKNAKIPFYYKITAMLLLLEHYTGKKEFENRCNEISEQLQEIIK